MFIVFMYKTHPARSLMASPQTSLRKLFSTLDCQTYSNLALHSTVITCAEIYTVLTDSDEGVYEVVTENMIFVRIPCSSLNPNSPRIVRRVSYGLS